MLQIFGPHPQGRGERLPPPPVHMQKSGKFGGYIDFLCVTAYNFFFLDLIYYLQLSLKVQCALKRQCHKSKVLK